MLGSDVVVDDTITWTKGEVLGRGAYGTVSRSDYHLWQKRYMLPWLSHVLLRRSVILKPIPSH